jgi:hypothetical protein
MTFETDSKLLQLLTVRYIKTFTVSGFSLKLLHGLNSIGQFEIAAE